MQTGVAKIMLWHTVRYMASAAIVKELADVDASVLQQLVRLAAA